MKIIKKGKEKLIKIILIISIIFTLFPTFSFGVSIGGILLKPICVLVTTFVDTINTQMSISFGCTTTLEAIGDNFGRNVSNVMEALDGLVGGDSEMTDKQKEAYNSYLSPEDIFSGKAPIGNADIFDTYYEAYDDYKLMGNLGDTLNKVRVGVGKYYVIIRNICISLSLCVLIYTGIKILIYTIDRPEKGAHEKMALLDWVKSICLIMCSHIIMAGIFWLSNNLIDLFANSLNDGVKIVGNIRYQLAGSWDTNQLVYLILYIYLVYLTASFLISYAKRFLWTLVLVILAPIVSLLYGMKTKILPHIYEKWLKEFVFNAMLPVYHTIVYVVLISIVVTGAGGGSSFFDSGIASIIYVLTALTFLKKSEKYIRTFFGFEKGIAGVGNVESGQAVIKSAIKMGTEAVKTVVTVGAAVATGGATAAAGAAGTAAKAGSTAAKGAVESANEEMLPKGNVDEVAKEKSKGKNEDNREGAELDDVGQQWLDYANDPSNSMQEFTGNHTNAFETNNDNETTTNNNRATNNNSESKDGNSNKDSNSNKDVSKIVDNTLKEKKKATDSDIQAKLIQQFYPEKEENIFQKIKSVADSDGAQIAKSAIKDTKNNVKQTFDVLVGDDVLPETTFSANEANPSFQNTTNLIDQKHQQVMQNIKEERIKNVENNVSTANQIIADLKTENISNKDILNNKDAIGEQLKNNNYSEQDVEMILSAIDMKLQNDD